MKIYPNTPQIFGFEYLFLQSEIDSTFTPPRQRYEKAKESMFVVWKEKEEWEVVWGALKSVIGKEKLKVLLPKKNSKRASFPGEKVITAATGHRQSLTKTSTN